MWDSRTGQCVVTAQGHQDHILDMALSPDGKHVLTGSDDKTARVFEFV